MTDCLSITIMISAVLHVSNIVNVELFNSVPLHYPQAKGFVPRGSLRQQKSETNSCSSL